MFGSDVFETQYVTWAVKPVCLVPEFYPTNQRVGSKFDSGDLILLLIGSACSKDPMFAARGTCELLLTLNFHSTATSKPKPANCTSGTQDRYLAVYRIMIS